MTTDPDPLDAALQKAQPYLDDDGFTARVLSALPPRRAARHTRAVILGGSALAAVLALVLGPARAGALALGAGDFGWPVLLAVALCVAVCAGTAVLVALREAEGW